MPLSALTLGGKTYIWVFVLYTPFFVVVNALKIPYFSAFDEDLKKIGKNFEKGVDIRFEKCYYE